MVVDGGCLPLFNDIKTGLLQNKVTAVFPRSKTSCGFGFHLFIFINILNTKSIAFLQSEFHFHCLVFIRKSERYKTEEK